MLANIYLFLLCSNELHNCEYMQTYAKWSGSRQKWAYLLQESWICIICIPALKYLYCPSYFEFDCYVLSGIPTYHGRMQMCKKNKKAFSLQGSHKDSVCNIGSLKVAMRQFQGKFQNNFLVCQIEIFFIQTEKQFPFINLLNLVYHCWYIEP